MIITERMEINNTNASTQAIADKLGNYIKTLSNAGDKGCKMFVSVDGTEYTGDACCTVADNLKSADSIKAEFMYEIHSLSDLDLIYWPNSLNDSSEMNLKNNINYKALVYTEETKDAQCYVFNAEKVGNIDFTTQPIELPENNWYCESLAIVFECNEDKSFSDKALSKTFVDEVKSFADKYEIDCNDYSLEPNDEEYFFEETICIASDKVKELETDLNAFAAMAKDNGMSFKLHGIFVPLDKVTFTAFAFDYADCKVVTSYCNF